MNKVMGLTAMAALLAGCAAPGGYQGLEAEKAYDKALDAARMTQVINNDDYYEIHEDGRIVVLSDAGDLKLYLGTGDIPLRVTRIGGGPKGETVVYGIASPEKNKKYGFGSVEMYDGRRVGAEKDFYAEVFQNDKWYVFGNWAALDAFRKTGNAAGLSAAGGSASGEAVLVGQPADALGARFHNVHGSGQVAAATPPPAAVPAKPAVPVTPATPPVKKKRKAAAAPRAPAAAPAKK